MPVANVYIADRWDNGIGQDDITSGEATIGTTQTDTWTIANNSNAYVSQVKIWIKPGVSGIEISDDNITFVSPDNEIDALELSDIAPSGTVTIYVKRTISAGAEYKTDVFNIFEISYSSI